LTDQLENESKTVYDDKLSERVYETKF